MEQVAVIWFMSVHSMCMSYLGLCLLLYAMNAVVIQLLMRKMAVTTAVMRK